VEVGEKIAVRNRHETGTGIYGTGSYTSAGKYIEQIENYPKSTRVRQVVIKGTEKNDVNLFVDFV
jgi:hypothetical protein